MNTHLSTLRLHQYRYGELSDAEEEEARAHLDACALCSERLSAQLVERAAFEARPVPEALRDMPPAPANDNRAWLRSLSLIAAVAAVLVAVIAQPWNPPDAEPLSGIRPKGHIAASHIEAFRDSATGPVSLGDGSEVRAGDRIQLRVQRPPKPWVTIAGVDGSGSASVFGSWQPSSSGWEPAPFGLTMDETMGTESIYIIYTATEPNRAALRAELVNGDPGPERSWEVLTLEKVP